MSERLQKFLASAGVASRRHAEELITQGRVTVNNAVVRELGTKVEPGKDLVAVDGSLVEVPEEKTHLLLYKPVGVVTTMEDPQGRPTVADYVRDVGVRVFPVGRLDFDAEGALIMTDDGELAHALTHPKFQVPRTYLAKVKGSPTPETLQRMIDGVRLEDGMAEAAEADVFEAAEKNTWIRIVVKEGRPHLIKRLCAAVGHPVVRLYRPAQGGISVQGLRPGETRALKPEEVERVRAVTRGEVQPKETLSLPPRRHGHGAPGTGEEEFEAAPLPARSTGGESRPRRSTIGRPPTPSTGRAAGGEGGRRGGSGEERGTPRGRAAYGEERGAPRGRA
ncbi:MAG: pseudouridine synthase, partial [Myxococcaceae bacterium]